jgi:hypothetical protein
MVTNEDLKENVFCSPNQILTQLGIGWHNNEQENDRKGEYHSKPSISCQTLIHFITHRPLPIKYFELFFFI